ncbi:hypothetical protein QE152_g15851 [Popillia japonica]|uniref:Uncharacterized protein n=1 Tax=Popillia japonica TaxID=7064 RepID=A0AAW1L819_POPJA
MERNSSTGYAPRGDANCRTASEDNTELLEFFGKLDHCDISHKVHQPYVMTGLLRPMQPGIQCPDARDIVTRTYVYTH